MDRTEVKTLNEYFRLEKAAFRGDNSEYARGFRRAMDAAISAVNAVRDGRTYDRESETWK